MKCKKCRKEIPDGSRFCNHCGTPITEKKKLYRRPDGLYEKIMTIDGKRVAFRAKKEADVYKKIREYEVKEEERSGGERFYDVAEMWDREHSETLAPSTARGYKYAYEEVRDHFADDLIREITAKDISIYMKQLPKSYARKTCANRLSILNMIFKYAEIEGYCESNPCDCVSVPKGHSAKKRRAPTDDEVKRIRAGIDIEYRGLRIGFLAVFLYYTGCRKGEALALKFRDIDPDAARISVTKSVYYVSNQPQIKKPKTEAGIREVIIPDYLLRLLPSGKKEEYVFCEPDGSLLRQHYFEKAWLKWQKETGLDLTAHQLRHGYATLLHEADIDVKDAQELLGHADAGTTQNIYTEVSNRRKNDTQKKLNAFLQ